MKKAILLKDLSENKIDKVIVNDKIKAGWLFTTCLDIPEHTDPPKPEVKIGKKSVKIS